MLTKVLFISACFIGDGKHAAKGDIGEYDPAKKSDTETIRQLRAGGRVAPLTRANVKLCVDQINKQNRANESLKLPTTPIPVDLAAAAKAFENPKTPEPLPDDAFEAAKAALQKAA
jgi:hypothetical protein